MRVPLEASVLGIAQEHVVGPCSAPKVWTPAFASVLPGAVPVSPVFARSSNFKRPLVGARTSFWLGVGFGIFIVGVLGYLAVRLFQVELAEAVVTGLTKTL